MNILLNKFSTESLVSHQFKNAFILSIGAHLLCFIIVFTIGKLSFSFLQSSHLSQEKIKQINSAVKVDVVGMPKYTLQELQKMKLPAISTEIKEPSKSTPKEQAQEVIDKNSFKTKGKNLDAILKKFSSRNVESKQKKGKVEENPQIKKLIIEGNKISSGSALVGDLSQEVLTDFENYIGKIPDLVREYWELPTFLRTQKDLKCRVRIFISSKGKLINSAIYESSGNEEYDAEALRAIQKVKSFPVPPQSIVHKVSSGEIVLGFPL